MQPQTFHTHYTIDSDSEDGRYFVACARIRKVALTVLVSRLLETIIRDQLVLAVLDDESAVSHQSGEHKYKGQQYAASDS